MGGSNKNLADILRESIGKTKSRTTAAIIVAGGSSTRMGGQIPKQFLDLCGMPVVVHALRAYEESEYIDQIYVVARAEDVGTGVYENYAEKFAITKFKLCVEGGKTRQESVLKGIEALSDDVKFVAIADAARPLTTVETINSVCLAAYRYSAASAGCPAVDTIKTVDNHKMITGTVERATAWQAATPQAFSLPLYRAAAYSALDDGFECTDDNSLVERLDRYVRMIDCGRYNIKITEKLDLLLAEKILDARDGILKEEAE
ncbi:MAG: 2-C-methyl-D-erythritol 4-phosphate cytidylyltransferase [Eubacteriales bacterium]